MARPDNVQLFWASPSDTAPCRWDATTLEANAAMRSIVRRDNGASYDEFLTGLARESGIKTPSREDLARLDRKRKKKTSNQEWVSPSDPDAVVRGFHELEPNGSARCAAAMFGYQQESSTERHQHPSRASGTGAEVMVAVPAA